MKRTLTGKAYFYALGQSVRSKYGETSGVYHANRPKNVAPVFILAYRNGFRGWHHNPKVELREGAQK